MSDELNDNRPDDVSANSSHVDGAASQQMQAMLNQTLSYYPEHYSASQGILATVTNHQRGWRCCGAMETCLSSDGMEVTFDYRYGKGESWRRLLVIITMADGKLTYRDYKEMAKGQHSGIMAFDAIEENVA